MATVIYIKWDPQLGDMVCSCDYKHQKIVQRNGDDVVLEDGKHYSLSKCCDDVKHNYPHCSHYRCAIEIH